MGEGADRSSEESGHDSTLRISSKDTVIAGSSVSAAITLAEPVIYVYGFSKTEQVERTPAILRGTLVVTVFKPSKIKSIDLEFRGVCRTEWPEGVPPKKVETHETTVVFRHGWTFFNAALAGAEQTSGAHVVYPLDGPDAPLATVRGRGRSNTLESGVKDILSAVTKRTASPSPALQNQADAQMRGYRLFQPAEYVYNFELPIPQIVAESIQCNFGSINYALEARIQRHGTFKANLSGLRDVTILRAPAMSNLESSEPIVISRDWENLLHYDVVIAGKAFYIGGSIPVAFSLVPLAKVNCHRIRIYLTEHTEYFCRNRKVHRVEPSHKFLLFEKVSDQGIQGSLLSSLEAGISTRTEFEYDVKIPKSFKDRRDRLRPNFTSEHIKVHHWIKVVMRLSRTHPKDPSKLKSYEVSIDSPVTLIDKRTISANQLPIYNDAVDSNTTSFAFDAHQQAATSIEPTRPIMFLRQPSIAPPPFDAESEPPAAFPPPYDAGESPESYRQRYEDYERGLHTDSDNSRFSGESLESSERSGLRSGPSSGAAASTFSRRSSIPEANTRFTEIIWRIDSDEESGDALQTVDIGVDTPESENVDPLAASPLPPRASVNACTGSSLAPVVDPLALGDPFAAPVDPNVAPVNTTAARVDTTAPRVNTTATPVNTTTAPVDPSAAPVVHLVAPVDPIAVPVDHVTSPVVPSPEFTTPPASRQHYNEGGEPASNALTGNGIVGRPGSVSTVEDVRDEARDEVRDEDFHSIVSSPTTGPVSSEQHGHVPSIPFIGGVASRGDSTSTSESAHSLDGFVFGSPDRHRTPVGDPAALDNLRSESEPSNLSGVHGLPGASYPSASSMSRRQSYGSRGNWTPLSPPRQLKTGPNSYGPSPHRLSSASKGSMVSPTKQDNGHGLAPRYFRQASVVSVDMVDQEHPGLRRWNSHVSEASEITDWYASRRGSESSIAISVSEYRGPDRNPLLGTMESDGDLAHQGDYEDDDQSICSGVYNVMVP